MIRLTPTRPAPPLQRWQSREEILKAHLDSLSPSDLLLVRPDYYAFTFGWDFVKRGYAQGRLAQYENWEDKAGFRQDQPRWPAGSGVDSGRWSGGEGTASPQPNRGPQTPPKHHFIPREIFEDPELKLRPETKKVFEQETTAPLRAGHGWSKDHAAYNDAVRDHLKRFLRENGITSDQMTPDHARKFLEEVKQSRDSRIRNFNVRIMMREAIYWLRRKPRGNE